MVAITIIEIKHKDPNGNWCKGKQDLRHLRCWHCDTCPYAKCVNEDGDEYEGFGITKPLF
mgnify:FL=1